jgi:Tol biopolymer transport system component
MRKVFHSVRTRGAVLTLTIALFLSSSLASAQYDIYTFDVKSGATTRITTGLTGTDEYNPSFSNNNRLIVHDVVSSGGAAQDLYITDVRTKTSTPLVGGENGNDASWSPNGRFIAFDTAPFPGGFPSYDPNIYIVSGRGGAPRLVVETSDGYDDAGDPTNEGVIQTRAVRGGPRTTVVESGQNPVWSPNGDYIAYSDGDADHKEIFVIRVSSTGAPIGAPVQLTTAGTSVYDVQPTWSNNSRTIVFHSNRGGGGSFDLWSVPASGGTPTRLTGIPVDGDFDPSYSSNGKLVAYAAVGAPSSRPDTEPQGDGDAAEFKEVVLEQNSPNPFNPSTVIQFQLPEARQVLLTVYNGLGQEVRTLASGGFAAGQHQVVWDARDDNGNRVPSGIYLYRLQAGDLVKQQKMILLK